MKAAVKRVAIYSRVSTTDQTIETQLLPLEKYVAARGFDVVARYEDVGVSGSKESRPQLDKLMKDAHARKFDAVVVYRFDRFARSAVHLGQALGTFKALGVDFISISEAADTTTPAGKLLFTVLAAVSEMERDIIIERVRSGMARVKATGKTRSGKAVGRPQRVFDREEARKLHQAGKSNRQIALALGVGKDTVRLAVQSAA